MALTTANAFEEFKGKLLLTDIQKDTVKSRGNTTEGYLRDAFPPSSDLSLHSTYLMGSAGRDTIIRPPGRYRYSRHLQQQGEHF